MNPEERDVLATVADRLTEAAELLRGLARSSGTDLQLLRDVPQCPVVDPLGLLSAREVASMLGTDTRTLRRWRHAGRAPKEVSVAGRPRWRRADVDAWLQEGR